MPTPLCPASNAQGTPERSLGLSAPGGPVRGAGWRAAGQGGGPPRCRVGQQPPLSPLPLPGGAERARVYPDKWRVNGAPGRGPVPSRKSPGAGARDAPRRGPHAEPEPPSPRLESGRWPTCPPRPRLRVLGSRTQSRTLGVWKRLRSGSAEPEAGTPGREVPGGAPGSPRGSLTGSPARGLRQPPAPRLRVGRPPGCAESLGDEMRTDLHV